MIWTMIWKWQGELTNAELLQAIQKIPQEVDGSDDDTEPPALVLCQKMKLVDFFRQEMSMLTIVPLFKQVESMVYSESSAIKRRRTKDSCSSIYNIIMYSTTNVYISNSHAIEVGANYAI